MKDGTTALLFADSVDDKDFAEFFLKDSNIEPYHNAMVKLRLHSRRHDIADNTASN